MNTETTPSQLQYAGFWNRFCAFLIDAFCIGALGVAIYAVLSSVLPPNVLAAFMDRDHRIINYSHGVFYIRITIELLLGFIYYVLMECSSLRGTLGKRVLGIQVTDNQGNQISFLRSLGRNAAKLLSAFILFIGFMMAGWTRRKQALHDMMLECLVLKTDTSESTDGRP